jgi:hypothetical protein
VGDRGAQCVGGTVNPLTCEPKSGALPANEGALTPSFVTRQFSEVSAADWLRRPSVPTVRWGFLIPDWGSRQRPWPVR